MTASPTAPPPAVTEVIGPAVRATGATRIYGEGPTAVHALAGVDVEVPRGQFAAIMGPSGSGKSTLLHCLAGLDRLTAGTVELDGVGLQELNDRRLTELRRRAVGFIFQSYNLIPTLTAKENITLPLDLAGRRSGGVPGSSTADGWFDQVVDTLGLRERLGHRPHQLSGGQQQRVAVARALISRPAVVFADEPTGALDSNASAELLEFLRRVSHEFQQTIVMVTHEPIAAAYADRVLFLADGQIVDEMAAPTAERVLDRIKQLEVGAPRDRNA
jgi:putative ABC transport system ATP-binding protein